MRQRLYGLALIVAANFIGGISWLWIRYAQAGLPGCDATITLIRTLIALLCSALVFSFVRRAALPLTGRERVRLGMVGIFGYALPIVLGNIGVALASSGGSAIGNASILILAEPASILFFSWLLLRDRLARPQLFGMLIAAGGVTCIALENSDIESLTGQQVRLGNIILATHGILWGIYTPLIKPLAVKHNSARLLLWVMLMALILLVPLSIMESARWSSAPDFVGALGWIFLLGFFVSFLGTWFWNLALEFLPAAVVAPFIFLQPLVGVGAGAIFLGESVSAQALFGGALIAAGIVPVIFSAKKAA